MHQLLYISELAEIPFQDPRSQVRKKCLDGVSIPWNGGDDFNIKTWAGINITAKGQDKGSMM